MWAEYSGRMTALETVAMISMHTSPDARPGRGDSGGMNVALLGLAQALARRGVAVDLLTRAERRPETVELSAGVTLRTLAAGPFGAVAKGDLAGLTDDFGEAVATLVGRSAPRYNVLHAHYWLSGLAVLPVALELGLPFVQSFHTLAAMKNATLAEGDTPESDRRVYSETFLANEADAVVAGSSAEVNTLIDEVRAPADKLWVIPPGVDTSLFTPARAHNSAEVRRRLGLEPDRPILVVAGRIQPLKAQELAVRVLGAIHAHHNLRGWAPVLVIAGEPTAGAEDYRDSLVALAASLGVAEGVRLVGSLGREELANLFAAASLTLIPSHSETFGLVALESAASGTPVVGYRSTGLTESVAEGQSGVLVDTRDAEIWARTVSDLLGNAPALLALGATARGHAEGFTWATAAASLTGVYKSLLVPR
jgi:D-inositol-3-phosphate glycosyltransferase